jgi:nitrogen fixation-related uncharacterized protein
MSSLFKNHIFMEIFNSTNILIVLLTIVFFLGILLLFFWFVLRFQFEDILKSKIEIISLYSKNDPTFKSIMTTLFDIKLPDETLNAAKLISDKRDEVNLNALSATVMPVLYAFIGLLLLTILYIMKTKGFKFTLAEWILVFFVFGAFLTELLFYYIIIINWKLIGDNEFLFNLKKGIICRNTKFGGKYDNYCKIELR